MSGPIILKNQFVQDCNTCIAAFRYATAEPASRKRLFPPTDISVMYAVSRLALEIFSTLAALSSGGIYTIAWLVIGYDVTHLLINEEVLRTNPAAILGTALATVAAGGSGFLANLFKGKDPVEGAIQESSQTLAKVRAQNTLMGSFLWVPLLDCMQKQDLIKSFN